MWLLVRSLFLQVALSKQASRLTFCMMFLILYHRISTLCEFLALLLGDMNQKWKTDTALKYSSPARLREHSSMNVWKRGCGEQRCEFFHRHVFTIKCLNRADLKENSLVQFSIVDHDNQLL